MAENYKIITVGTPFAESCGDIAVATNSTLTLYTVNLSKVNELLWLPKSQPLAFQYKAERKLFTVVF